MTRTDLLNNLAEKYGLNRYLEIGVQNPAQNFDKIVCEDKVSVDPDPAAHANFCLTSDNFFNIVLQDQYMGGGNYDLVFIDGLHTAEQVKKDFKNALKILSPKGFIVIHDCNPLKEEHTIVPRPTPTGHWNGDVYKFAVTIAANAFYTVNIDNGCGVFGGTENKDIPLVEYDYGWDYFDKHRKELLNLISFDEFIKL